MPPRRLEFHTRPFFKPFGGFLFLTAILGIFAVSSKAHAQADYYPIEGGGGATVYCYSGQGLQQTVKGTVTACLHARDATIAVASPSGGTAVSCKEGHPITFQGGKLQSCVMGWNAGELLDVSGAKTGCRAGATANFREDGRLASCESKETAGAGQGQGTTPAEQGQTRPAGDAVACDSLMKALEADAKHDVLPGCVGRAEFTRPFAYDNGYCVGAHKFWSRCQQDNIERPVLEWYSKENPGRVSVPAVRRQFEKKYPNLPWH